MRYRLRALLLPALLLIASIAVVFVGAASDSNVGAVTGAALLVAAGVALQRSFVRA